MKKPIRRFPEHSDMTPPKTYLKNTVSLCKKEKHIHFNQYQWQYFTIESLEDDNTFSILCASGQTANSQTILVSLDNGNTWEEKTASSGGTEIFTLNTNQKALIKSNTWKPNANNNYEYTIRCRFIANNAYKIYGNILSLVYGDNFLGKNTLNNIARTFQYLFYKSINLKDASNLVLNATTLTAYCYYYMFAGCTNLTTAPELPATTLASHCYQSMFYGCSNLLTAPSALPALTLYGGCYQGMFEECRSLTAAPELPATTIASSCYIDMFRFCTSLKTGPTILPALTLYDNCYRRMFRFCNNLENAPILPAPILVTYCYHHMFDGANKINHVKCLANSGFETEDCITNWLLNTSSTGTFVKAQGVEWPSGVSGIPDGWTVEEEAV